MIVNSPHSLRKIQNNRNLKLLILLIFTVIILNSLFFLYLISENKQSLRKRRLNENAMMLTRKILGSMKDAEIGQRGYILTGREKYILPYTKTYNEISVFQRRLDYLVKQNFSQEDLKLVRGLNKAIAIKRTEMVKTIRLKVEERDLRLLKLINSDLGENEMTKIREICNRLLTSFYKNLEKEDQQVSTTLNRAAISVAIFSTIALTGMMLMFIKLINRKKKIYGLFKEQELQNTQLLKQQLELKRLSMDFSSRNSELEHFTHIISHDLRGPLSNIISLIRIIDDEGGPGSQDPSFLMLKNVTSGLFHRMDDLLLLLRQRKGTLLLKDKLSLSLMVEEFKNTYSMEIENSGTTIETDFSAVDEVFFVKIYLQSILQNLISNAIKYREPVRNNKVMIKSLKKDDTVVMTIADNGKGINMDKYGKDIFGLFKTFHSGQDSHGIGLYLVKKQLTEMEGSIIIDSEAGKGTIFTITIPD